MITDLQYMPANVPFSLSCCECDADGPTTLEEARATGWTSIQPAPDLPMANFVGCCPEHSAEPAADSTNGEAMSQLTRGCGDGPCGC